MGRHHHTICLKIAGVFAPRPAPTPTALPRERLIGGQDGRPLRSPVGTVLQGSNYPFNEERTLLGHEHLDTLQHCAKLTIADLKKTHAKCHPRERES